MAKQAILMLGAPGSGKGTQAKNLEKEYGFVQISTGELLRERVKVLDELGKQISDFMNVGAFVPDELISKMLVEHIRSAAMDKILFDGFPRNETQIQIFEKLLQELGIEELTPIYLHVEEEELIRRLLKRAEIEGRADDTEGTIGKRIKTYNTLTHPVVDHYATYPNFIQVSGDDQPAEVVWEELKGRLSFK